MIYLDTSDPNVQFDENHLRLFSAIGGMAAMALENAQTVALLENENRRLQAEIDIEHNMIGESSQMLRVYEFIAKVAPTDSTVLITGGERYRQRAGSAGCSCQQLSSEQSVCGHQLCRFDRVVVGERALRP